MYWVHVRIVRRILDGTRTLFVLGFGVVVLVKKGFLT